MTDASRPRLRTVADRGITGLRRIRGVRSFPSWVGRRESVFSQRVGGRPRWVGGPGIFWHAPDVVN